MVRSHLLRMGLRVVLDVDRERLGLAIQDGAIQWKQIAGPARRAALELGFVDPTVDQQPEGDLVIDWDAGRGVVVNEPAA